MGQSWEILGNRYVGITAKTAKTAKKESAWSSLASLAFFAVHFFFCAEIAPSISSVALRISHDKSAARGHET